MAPLRFGLLTLQSAPYARLAEQWRRAEALGFDTMWVADHTTAAYPDLIAYEAWSLLGALARETRRVRLGTLVTSIALRHPSLLAMAASTVDHASDGRLEVGIGAAGSVADARMVGQEAWPAAERLERLEETVRVLDGLLRGETLSRDGPATRYRLLDARVHPPVQRPRPPILIAANGPRAIRLAARWADNWSTLGGQPFRPEPVLPIAEAAAATRRQAEVLDEELARLGRDPAGVRRSVLAYRVDPFASVDACADFIGRYAEAGLDDFIFYWPSDPQTFAPRPEGEAILERVATDLLPRLRADGPPYPSPG